MLGRAIANVTRYYLILVDRPGRVTMAQRARSESIGPELGRVPLPVCVLRRNDPGRSAMPSHRRRPTPRGSSPANASRDTKEIGRHGSGAAGCHSGADVRTIPRRQDGLPPEAEQGNRTLSRICRLERVEGLRHHGRSERTALIFIARGAMIW
jgi:hypothetical protein